MANNPFRRDDDRSPILIVGLGRFGSSVARSLVAMGQEVLAVDTDPVLVQRYADELTHVVQADVTDHEALDQLGIRDFDKAVELLRISGAAAGSIDHGKILERIGAHHIVYPERSMGEQVAHMIVGGMSQYLEFDDDFAIARTMAPPEQSDKTFTETGVRARFGVTIVGVKRIGQDFIYAVPETLVKAHDELVVSGPTKKVEDYCALAKPKLRRPQA